MMLDQCLQHGTDVRGRPFRREPSATVAGRSPIPAQIKRVYRVTAGLQRTHDGALLSRHLKVEIGQRTPSPTVQQENGAFRSSRLSPPDDEGVAINEYRPTLRWRWRPCVRKRDEKPQRHEGNEPRPSQGNDVDGRA